MCSSTILTYSASVLSWNKSTRSIARSGASICRIQAGIDHGLIFVMHLACDGVEIPLIGGVMRVEHRRCDDARRRLGEEHFREGRLDLRGGLLEARQLGLDGFLVVILQLADAFRAAEHFAGLGNARREFFGEQRIFKPFLAERTFRFAAKAVHALGDISLKADAALFAVIGDVDAGPALFLHHVKDALLDLLGELGLDRPSRRPRRRSEDR